MSPLHLSKLALARWHEMNPTLRENLLVFGSLALVLAGVLVWTAFFRKPHRHSPHRHRHHPPRPERTGSVAGQDHDGSAGASAQQRHKRRRRRREHRPRNPTLAETGGLPPLRAETPPESFP